MAGTPTQTKIASANGSAAQTTELRVDGMTCSNCARHVTEAIQSVAGVHRATVMLESNHATVRWENGAAPKVAALVRAITEAGFAAREVEPSAPGSTGHAHGGWQSTLWMGVAGTVPLMAGEWVFNLTDEPWFRWLSFGIATVVQIFCGAQFYRGAWRQLRAGSSNMDTLVALGSTTAFGYSTWALLSGQAGHLFFMEAAAIITLVSLGHWLEARVSARASSALRQLLELAPPLARRRNRDDSETEVPAGELRHGDLIVLRPGDRIPTDGQVIEGDSAVDEAMLTGESIPADKTAGSNVYTGTSNLNGRLVVRVTATGAETALAHVIAAVQRAQTSRANIQRLGDRVSSVFVPIVVLVALASGLWWGLAYSSALGTHAALARFLWPAHPPATALAAGFIIAAGVLIVACPCAMGLATPAAIMAASNAAARRGILIRDGVALEKAGRVTVVVFDKTGTLTLGKPSVVETWTPLSTAPVATGDRAAAKSKDESEARSLAAALAQPSSHPISRALAGTTADGIRITDWEEVRGSGVQAKLPPGVSESNQGGELARLGSLRWLLQSSVDLTPGDAFVNRWSAQGATIVGVSVAGTLRGLFAVKDTLRPGARAVVEGLRGEGLKTFLVTGDQPLTAASIAGQAGIAAEDVFGGVRPEEKAAIVRRLQQQGNRVAFVGDGINDAPALEQADLGIAVSRASDIARESADIVLLNSEIEVVPECLGLARATLRTIKQNLFWAFFYNALGIPLAAVGFLSPVLCAAAMGFSDFIVIGNALRLRRWRA